MMTEINLDAMELKELKKLRKKVEAAINGYEERQRANALAELEAKAKELGFSLAELTNAKAKLKKPAAPAKYRNPADATQTWSGRGRQPEWFKSAINAGKSAADMEI